MKKRTKRILLWLCVPPGLLMALLLSVVAAVFWALCTPSGLQTVVGLVNRFGGDMVSITSAEGRLDRDFTLKGVRYQGGGLEARVESLRLHWDPWALKDKRAPIHALELKNVDLRLPETTEEPKPPEPETTEPLKLPEVELPVAVSLDAFSLEGFRLFSGKAEEPLVHVQETRLSNLTLQGHDVNLEELAAKAAVAGVQAEATLKAKVAMQGDWPLEASLGYGATLEGFKPIRGALEAAGDLAELTAKVAVNAPLTLNVQAKATDVLNDLHWEAEVQSPKIATADLSKDLPAYVAENLLVKGRGDLANYAADVSVRASGEPLRRPLTIRTSVAATAQDVKIQSLKVIDGPGSLELKGVFAWAPALAWDVTLGLENLNPDLVTAEVPGTVSGALSAKGGLADGKLDTAVNIAGIRGRLRGYPLEVSGSAAYKNDVVDISALHAAVGRTRADIRGKLADTYDLKLKLDSPDLKELAPQLSGRVQADLAVTGTRRDPVVALDLSGSNVDFGAGKLAALQGKARVKAHEGGAKLGAVEADFGVRQLAVGDFKLERISLQADGALDRHVLTLSAQGKDQEFGLELAGRQEGQGWAGELRKLLVNTPESGRWQQSGASRLRGSAESAELEPLCLLQGKTRLCVGGSWRAKDQRWRGTVQLADLDLEQYQKYVPKDLQMRVAGRVNLNAEAEGQNADVREAHVSCAIPGLSVRFLKPGSPLERLVWKTQQVEAHYAGRQARLDWTTELEDGSSLRIQANSPRLPLTGDLMAAPIQGRVAIDLRNLGFIDTLTDQQTKWTGPFKGDLTLGGTIGKPSAAGKLGLLDKDAGILIPEIALKISPLVVNLSGDPGKLLARVEAHSEKGALTVEAGVDLTGAKPVILPVVVRGEDFRAVNKPGFYVDVSPDVRVSISDERIEVGGKVVVPRARIESVSFSSRGIAPSGDVVVVDDPDRKEAGPPAQIFLNLTAEVGNQVIVNAYGLYARVSGKLTLSQKPGRVLSGNGQVNIDQGSFTILGKRVKIDVGRILFSGGPLTNPGIDIKSENKERDLTAGMRVEGLLQSPKITLYSKPYLEQGEIVTHLAEDTNSFGDDRHDTGVVGDTAEALGMGGLVPYLESIKRLSMIDDIKLDTKSDNPSLVLGSWITPNFYVSYGKSIAGGDKGPVFSTKYKLGKGFVVETESGETQNAFDIKYEFEY